MKQHYTLLGHPVAKSLSPFIHNAAFAHYKLNATYSLSDVSSFELQKKIKDMRSGKLCGANVTVPYKTTVIEYIDEVSPIAKMCNSVNTLYIKDNKILGDSTDGWGALTALREKGIILDDKNIIVLGTGGAAKALIAAIITNCNAQLTIVGRNSQKLQQITGFFNREAILIQHSKDYMKRADIIINATSVGMYPEENNIPINCDWLFAHHIVFDLVYKPLKTLLLREAEKKGAQIIDGLGMLIYQGAKAFELWTKRSAPIEVMKTAVYKNLLER